MKNSPLNGSNNTLQQPFYSSNQSPNILRNSNGALPMAGMNMMRPGSSSQQQLFQNNLARMQGNMGMI